MCWGTSMALKSSSSTKEDLASSADAVELPGLSVLVRRPAQFLALGLGSGLAPKAPGTWGSAAGVLLYLISMSWLSLEEQIALMVLSFVIGVYLCDVCSEALGVHDHGAIVWDEFVGQWMVLAFVCGFWGSNSLGAIVLAFGLFRLFDIFKPWPIKWADQQVHGGFGIMLDDVLAAIMAIVALIVLKMTSLLNWILV